MLQLFRIIAAWGTIARDITSNNLQGKAVVVAALSGEKSRS